MSDCAQEYLEISPELIVEELPAIALPGEFERVTGVRPYTTLEEQAVAIRGGACRHLPTIAYRYRDAIIADGTVYVRGAFENIAARRRRPVLIDQARDYSCAMLCADMGSDMFFGRWLRDSLAKEMLASERGLTPINQPHPKRLHESGYRSMLDLHADMPRVARIRDLWVVDDRGYNHDHVRRFRLLRERLRPLARGHGPEYVYISRGTIAEAGRSIQNAAAVEDALCAQGFAVIHPEAMEPEAIRQALAYAKIVVAVEGSALAHAQLSMPEGGTIIAIQPATRFSTAHKSVAEAAGLRFGYLVAETHNNQLVVDVDRLMKTIDLIQSV